MPSTAVLEAMTKLVTSQPVIGNTGGLDPGWVPDDKLQNDLDAVLAAQTALGPHKFAVVDLTEDPDNPDHAIRGFNRLRPAYAGTINHDEQVWIGSLAKLLPLYGAFRLRADLNALSGAVSVSNLATAATGIRQDYRRMQISAATSTLPKVEKMFDPLSAPAQFNFARSTKNDAQLDPFNHGSLPLDSNFTLLPAREHLRLMAGWSDDQSASSVIQALGFDYLWWLTNHIGLFRRHWDPLTRNDGLPSGAGGLFVGQDFSGNLWDRRPPLAPLVSNQAGTARSVAMLLTLLAQDRLVWDHAGNVGMREMLRKTTSVFTGRAEVSPIGVGMAKPGPAWRATQPPWNEDTTPIAPPTDPTKDIAAAKVGEATSRGKKVICDGLIVRTTRPRPGGSITITAVLVGIDNTQTNPVNLNDFGKLMAEKLDLRHPVRHPP